MNNTRHRIAYCIPGLHYPSGMERALTLKANYMAEHFGYEIHIILTEGKDKTPYYPLHPSIRLHQLDLNFDELYSLPLPKRLLAYALKQRKYRRLLDACLREIRPDITVSLLRREINFITKLRDGSVKIGEIHFNKSNYRDFSNNNMPRFIQERIAKVWLNQLVSQLRRLSAFVVLTEEDAAEWTELNNVSVIPNALPFYPSRYSAGSQKQVIAVGRYVPQKGFDRLIDAWQLVAKKHPDWTLKIYGDGMRDELQKQIDRLHLQSSCRLEHTVSDIEEKYIESSIFVLSSRFEGFGMVLVEAMACGLAPVAFTCPCGPRDIIRDGEDGLLVENGDIEQLATKICYLIGNDEVRRDMGRNARDNVQRFKIEEIAAEWKRLFDAAVKKKKNKS